MNLALNKEDIDLLVEQIRQIILNKPIKEELKSESEELAELQGSRALSIGFVI